MTTSASPLASASSSAVFIFSARTTPGFVQGSIAQRGGTVLRDDVECPSLSPDETRVAYKHTLGGGKWHLHVYDLQTHKDVALAETRSIDDQPSWLDDEHVAYFDGKATDVVPANGSGTPQVLVKGADSPTLLRRPVS